MQHQLSLSCRRFKVDSYCFSDLDIHIIDIIDIIDLQHFRTDMNDISGTDVFSFVTVILARHVSKHILSGIAYMHSHKALDLVTANCWHHVGPGHLGPPPETFPDRSDR